MSGIFWPCAPGWRNMGLNPFRTSSEIWEIFLTALLIKFDYKFLKPFLIKTNAEHIKTLVISTFVLPKTRTWRGWLPNKMLILDQTNKKPVLLSQFLSSLGKPIFKPVSRRSNLCIIYQFHWSLLSPVSSRMHFKALSNPHKTIFVRFCALYI